MPIDEVLETPRATNLDSGFDQAIKDLPEEVFLARIEEMLDQNGYAALSRDPFTIAGRLRDEVGGIIPYENGGLAGVPFPNVFVHDLSKPCFVALGHAAVSEIGRDRERFRNEDAWGAHGKRGDFGGKLINMVDGDEHRQMRRLFDRKIFGRAAINEWAESIIVPTVEYLVERVKKMAARGEKLEARRDIALPAVYKTVSTLIGVPQDQFAYFLRLSETSTNSTGNLAASLKASAELDRYFTEQLAERRQQPKPDLLTMMDRAEEANFRLADDEIISHARMLLPGGIDTTWRQSANLLMCMLRFPDQYRAVVQDPMLINSTIEEALRWAPSGFVVPRRVAVDTEVDGVHLPAGALIASIQGIANRDPKVFKNADSFDQRRSPNPHLTFHTGVHNCMGQMLARNILRVILTIVARELPGMHFAGDPSTIETRGLPNRNPKALPFEI